jgi:hypothetical protein
LELLVLLEPHKGMVAMVGHHLLLRSVQLLEVKVVMLVPLLEVVVLLRAVLVVEAI